MTRIKMKFSELVFPRKLNLRTLQKILSESELEMLVVNNLDKDKAGRRIVLPSLTCFRKVVCHHFGCLVEKGELSWDEVMKRIKGSFASLKEFGDSRKKVKRLYEQRKKEIANEK